MEPSAQVIGVANVSPELPAGDDGNARTPTNKAKMLAGRCWNKMSMFCCVPTLMAAICLSLGIYFWFDGAGYGTEGSCILSGDVSSFSNCEGSSTDASPSPHFEGVTFNGEGGPRECSVFKGRPGLKDGHPASSMGETCREIGDTFLNERRSDCYLHGGSSECIVEHDDQLKAIVLLIVGSIIACCIVSCCMRTYFTRAVA